LFWLFVLVVLFPHGNEWLVTALVEKFLFGANDSAFKLPPFSLRTPNRSPSKTQSVHPALAGSSGDKCDANVSAAAL